MWWFGKSKKPTGPQYAGISTAIVNGKTLWPTWTRAGGKPSGLVSHELEEEYFGSPAPFRGSISLQKTDPFPDRAFSEGDWEIVESTRLIGLIKNLQYIKENLIFNPETITMMMDYYDANKAKANYHFKKIDYKKSIIDTKFYVLTPDELDSKVLHDLYKNLSSPTEKQINKFYNEFLAKLVKGQCKEARYGFMEIGLTHAKGYKETHTDSICLPLIATVPLLKAMELCARSFRKDRNSIIPTQGFFPVNHLPESALIEYAWNSYIVDSIYTDEPKSNPVKPEAITALGMYAFGSIFTRLGFRDLITKGKDGKIINKIGENTVEEYHKKLQRVGIYSYVAAEMLGIKERFLENKYLDKAIRTVFYPHEDDITAILEYPEYVKKLENASATEIKLSEDITSLSEYLGWLKNFVKKNPVDAGGMSTHHPVANMAGMETAYDGRLIIPGENKVNDFVAAVTGEAVDKVRKKFPDNTGFKKLDEKEVATQRGMSRAS